MAGRASDGGVGGKVGWLCGFHAGVRSRAATAASLGLALWMLASCSASSAPEEPDTAAPDTAKGDQRADGGPDQACLDSLCGKDVLPDVPDLVSDADGVCLPDCQGKACGEDGCGGVCGTCPPGQGCEAGGCVEIPCVEGAACDDLNPCTFEDTCADGVCAGEEYTCDDGKECTKNECDGVGDCTFPVAAGYCLINNVCHQAGDVRPGNACEECLPNLNKTGWSKDDTNECSDGNACTGGDFCSDGECFSGPNPVECANPGPCKSVVCVPATGCEVSPAPGNCDDGNPCTMGDYCQFGECAAGLTPKACPGSSQCVSAYCDPSQGCLTTNLTGPCNDGDTCTDGEYCLNGACAGGTVKGNCNDHNDCTTDICTVDGSCIYQWNTASCNDGNACTENDTCFQGACAGTPKSCNDNNVCTLDGCNPGLLNGCYHENNDFPCEDPDPCTVGDVCSNGVCVAGTGQKDCNDWNDCTLDNCTPGVGCTHAAVVASCEDGDACTQGDYCASKECISGPNLCFCQADADCAKYEDGNKCNGTLVCDLPSASCTVNPLTIKACSTQFDTFCMKNLCDPATGLCGYKPANEGLGCDDSDGCTGGDACISGVCSGASCASSGLACYFGECGPQMCLPLSSICVGNSISTCNQDGSSLVQTSVCPTGTTCVNGTNKASCTPQICPPDTLVCQDNWVMLCDSKGLNETPVENCNTSGLYCYKGGCEQIFLCDGQPCPALPGYSVTCNSKLKCEYANIDPTGWRAWDVWIYVRPGSFQMGSESTETGHQADESPVHSVTFAKGYFIMKYLVTVEQYLACKQEAGCTDLTGVDWNGLGWELNWGETPTSSPKHYRPKHPQTGIHFDQAGFVCDWLVPGVGVGRIPTEAEYEFAATGPDNVLYPWGNTPAPSCAAGLAAYDDNTLGSRPWSCDPSTTAGSSGTVQVGTKAAGLSWAGALDMTGNVKVWTQDWYHADFTGAPTDGSAWVLPVGSERVLKGAGFDQGPADLRTAERGKRAPQSRDANVGARCVRPEPDPMTYVVWPICDPDSLHCKNTIKTKCNATGTGLEDLYDCADFGLVCSEGVCVDEGCAANCAGKECGPDGCGGLCGTCAAGKWCSGLGHCMSDIGLVWKPVPAGTFVMGCTEYYAQICASYALPKHNVSISAFEMLETEVTQAQYEAVVGVDPSCNFGGAGGPNYPVECVTWDAAKTFCEAVGGRLPTEAEWEYAARAGNGGTYPCEYELTCMPDYAVFKLTHKYPIKSRQANAFGLYELLGNVWEWTADWYSSSYYSVSPAADPPGPATGTTRVIRGGAFNSALESMAFQNRGNTDPATTNNSLGFRCAR